MSVPLMKSIHLTKEEVELVHALAEQEYLAESALLEKLFSGGLHNYLKELAINTYTKGMVSIGEAAQMARMPYLDFFKVTKFKTHKLSWHFEGGGSPLS